MERKSYDIVVHSRIWYYTTVLLGIVGFVIVGKIIGDQFTSEKWEWYYFLPFYALVFVGSFIAAYWIAHGKIRVTLSPQGISQKWLKPFLFSGSDGFLIPWKEVESYEICLHHEYRMNNAGAMMDAFYLRLTGERQYRILRVHSTFAIKDDWTRFITEFEKVANSLKAENSNSAEQHKVSYQESDHSFVFRGMFFFGLAVLAFFFWMKLSGRMEHMSWWVLGLIALFVLGYATRGFGKKEVENKK
jgi:hypothetical protein